MWNPFRNSRVRPILVKDTPPAPVDASTESEIELAQLRSLATRTQALMAYERFASEAVLRVKGRGAK